MKKVVAAAIVAVLLCTGASLHASEAMKAIVASYMDIHGRLFRDNLDGIKQSAAAIEQQATRMGATGANLAKAAKGMEAAADLKAAREAFGSLSDAVIAAGKAEGWKDVPDVKVAYCPMVNKSWLQKDGTTIRNPYFGPAMPTCGEFKK
jgi:membrane fusion protein, copper/silver efflux system